jgi:glycogen debranching enzyme
MLADGLDDWTVRPNIFIAAYVYPELLSKTEWTLCFKNALPKLWLSWGGLASIDKNNPLFTPRYTGETRQSYHRGDSWFWINNLAALVMSRTNKAKFKRYIDAIAKASAKEILTSGAVGHHAEVSSASRLESQGCMAQAWSDAMFIELVEEL